MDKHNTVTANRVHYLDAMRGVLMLLGVFYHSALVFSRDRDWAIQSTNVSEIAYWMGEILHLFRMPVFFMISGYFVLFTIRKYGPDSFIKIRLKRILIPLISTALTFNVLQAYILHGADWGGYYFHRGWISHLWFLWNLIFYFTVVFIVYKFIETKKQWFSKLASSLLKRINIHAVLFVFPIISIALLGLGRLLPDDIVGISVSSVLYYFPFFLIGMMMLFQENLLQQYVSINIFYSLVIAVAGYVITHSLSAEAGLLQKVMVYYIKTFSVLYIGSLTFRFFMRFLNKQSKWLYFFAESSYTIYLIHHVLVIYFASLLIQYNIGGFLGFVVLSCSVTMLSFLFHVFLIKKSKTLMLLYNGK